MNIISRRIALTGLLAASLFFTGCASTSSTVIPVNVGQPNVAFITMSGKFGEQATELISQQLAEKGIVVAEASIKRNFSALDTDLSISSPKSIVAMSNYGDELGVDYILTGTTSTSGGPLYSYDHVKMTVRLIDIKNGQTRWIGQYGNSMWSTAISTQGDLQRGAKHIVSEFISSGGANLIK